MKHPVLALAMVAIILSSCGTSSNENATSSSTTSSTISKEDLAKYKEVLASVQSIEQALQGITTMSPENAIQLSALAQQLNYDYDPMGMDSASQAACEMLKQRLLRLKPQIDSVVTHALPYIRVDAYVDHDCLVDKPMAIPVYLQRGDTLYANVQTERACTLKIYNADAKSTLVTRTGKAQYQEKLGIKNAAIYLVEINPGSQSQYADIDIFYTANSVDRLQNPKRVTSEEVEAVKGDWRARTVKGIKMQNLFEEPRKFTLRGQFKATFSGSYRALVAVQVPAGATDILYSLRISTNEGGSYDDGKFHDHMETSYKRVKMLGLPVYESHKGAGLIATLLGENQPVREEDAYINMYVFYNAAQAKKFQDGVPASKLSYNVDYSTLGTQSCNGRIPSKGNKTIYLAFENERMRYNNYVWLEAVSAVPNTEYFKTKYTVR